MARTGWAHMNGLLAAAATTCWCCCTPPAFHFSSQAAPCLLAHYPSSRFWLSVGELSGLLLLGMRAPSGSGQVQPWVVAAW